MHQYEKYVILNVNPKSGNPSFFAVSTTRSWLELPSRYWWKCFASYSRSRFYLSWKYARGVIFTPTTRKRVSLIVIQNSITFYILVISASLYRHFSNVHIVSDQILIVQISTRRPDSDGSLIRFSLKYKEIECIVFRKSAFCIQSRQWERESRWDSPQQYRREIQTERFYRILQIRVFRSWEKRITDDSIHFETLNWVTLKMTEFDVLQNNVFLRLNVQKIYTWMSSFRNFMIHVDSSHSPRRRSDMSFHSSDLTTIVDFS